VRGGTSDDAEAQAERIASRVFVAGRGGQIAFSALMLANDWRRYDRSWLQAATLAGVIIESGWLTRRLIRAGRYDDRPGVWVDCLSAAAALMISQFGLGERGAAPWAKNIAIGAAIGAASTRCTADTVGTVGALCAAAIGTGLRARGRDAHVAGLSLAINDAVSWAGTHVASRSYLNAHRRYARLRDEADALKVERAAAGASEAERSRQREVLHEVTAGVLADIAGSAGLGPAQAAARGEVARLRYALRTGGQVPRGLHSDLAELTELMSARGLRVELVTAELGPTADSGAGAALRVATQRALEAARDRGGASRAVVRAISAGDAISVIVRDHGRGFEPGAGGGYESELLALRDLLDPWGGTITIWSEPGGGVRVMLGIGASDHGVDPDPGNEPAGSGVSRFADLSQAQARLANRALLTALLAWRATGLATGGAALIAGGTRYRSRSVAVAQLGIAAAESAWYARRSLSGDRWRDQTTSAIDAATAVGTVLLGRANLDDADRSTWINWPPWTFAANVICGQAMAAPSAAAAVAGAAAVIAAHATQNRRLADAVADSVALAAFFSVAGLLAAQTRASAVRLEQARSRAEAEGRGLARERERSIQLRVLHDHALQTLEAIASGQCSDLSLVRSQARAEAARLGRALDDIDPVPAPRPLAERLSAILADHAGLVIDFECQGQPDAPELVIQAFCGAVAEALTNVRKHAQANSVRIIVGNADGRLAVTIADDGIGFDPSAACGSFGIRESIRRRMREVGGVALVESAPGAGTVITLSRP
jgi:signal transduction histidine kinase